VDWRIELKVVPWLAESWKQEDPKTYTFQLRKGVKFHDGADFTAKDVVASYKRFSDPNEKISPQIRLQVEQLDGATLVDDYTVRVTAKRPDPDFLANIADARVPILSSKFMESGGDLTKQVVGTGPFKLQSYRKDAEGVAVRHENFWMKGRPYLDGVKYSLRVDDSTMSAAFVAGQADILMRNDKNQFAPIQAANPRVQHAKVVVNQLYSVNINVARPPLNDARVRRAMFLALDRQELDKAVTFGEGTLSLPLASAIKTGWTIKPEEILKQPGYRQPKDQDLAEAKRLMAEAGYANGFKTTLSYQSGFGFTPQASEAVQQQLKRQLNIDADLQPLDNPTYIPRRTGGQFDLVVEAASQVDRPSNYAWTYFHSTGIYSKAFGIKDDDLDKLVEAQSNEFDYNKRGEIYMQLQRLLMDRVYTIPLPQAAIYAIWHPWVHDWVDNKANRQTVMNPWQIWMDLEQAPPDRKSP